MALGIEARKAIIANCKMIQPFIPPVVAGRKWKDNTTEAIASEQRFFSFEPGARWHGFEGYASDQYFVDPCKLLLTTPGIDAESGKYTDFGIPATILAHYLRENGIVLYLSAPAEVLASRLQANPNAAQRPTLTGKSIAEEVAEVLAAREPLYRETATHILNAAATPKELLAEALAILKP